MISNSSVVWYCDTRCGWWPARVLEVNQCLKAGRLFLLYEIRLFGVDCQNAPSQDRLFAEESKLCAFQSDVQVLPSNELKRAISIAKRYLKRQSDKNPNHKITIEEAADTEAEITNTETQESCEEGNWTHVPWNIRKTVANKLYRAVKQVSKMERGDAQDLALEVQRGMMAASHDIKEYAILLSHRLLNLRTNTEQIGLWPTLNEK